MTNPTELLDGFSRELYNKGEWRWTGKDGYKARILTAVQKMLKAGMPDLDVKNIILELESSFYVEHERQVKAKTGLSVREFMEKKLKDLGPLPKCEIQNQENDHEHLHSSVS